MATSSGKVASTTAGRRGYGLELRCSWKHRLGPSRKILDGEKETPAVTQSPGRGGALRRRDADRDTGGDRTLHRSPLGGVGLLVSTDVGETVSRRSTTVAVRVFMRPARASRRGSVPVFDSRWKEAMDVWFGADVITVVLQDGSWPANQTGLPELCLDRAAVVAEGVAGGRHGGLDSSL
jgi:hypothetical protein